MVPPLSKVIITLVTGYTIAPIGIELIKHNSGLLLFTINSAYRVIIKIGEPDTGNRH